MLTVAVSEHELEAVLDAGELSCPVCSGRLSRWGFARGRQVRMLSGARSARPRRVLCDGCGRTHSRRARRGAFRAGATVRR